MNYNTVIIFKLLCLCVDAEVHRERQTAGADSGLPGQRVRCGSSAGGRRDQERSAGTHGGTAGAQHTGRYTAHTHTRTDQPRSQMIQVQSCVSVSQLSSRLQESEREAMEKVSDLEKKLIQTTKEVELLKVEYAALLFTFSLLLVKAQLGIFC